MNAYPVLLHIFFGLMEHAKLLALQSFGEILLIGNAMLVKLNAKLVATQQLVILALMTDTLKIISVSYHVLVR